MAAAKNKIVSVTGIVYFSLLMLAFSVPLYKKIVPYFIALFFLSWCAYMIVERKHIHVEFKIPRLFSVLLYLTIAVSLLYTTNIKAGFFDLEVKLSLLFFPLIMSFSGDVIAERKRFDNVLSAFVAGTFAITIICLAIAFYRCFTIFFTLDFFTYTYLASFHHPTYFAMFLNLAVAVLIYRIIERWHDIKPVIKAGMFLLVFYFVVFILLLNSKAGILALFLNIMGIIFYYTLIRKKVYVFLVLLTVLVTCSFLVIRLVPFVYQRFEEMKTSIKNYNTISLTTENDSEQRILIWRYSSEIIGDTWATGVGAGDVTSSLNKVYLEHGFIHGEEKNLNCHNQFLQTFVSTGIAGFLFLILLLASLLIIALKNRNVILFSFFIIITSTMLSESILETQAGTVFFGFFLSFLVNFRRE